MKVQASGSQGSPPYAPRYALWGGAAGLSFPLAGAVLQAALAGGGEPFGAALAHAHRAPALWLLWLVPTLAAALAGLWGRQIDRTGGLASDLFSSAQNLLSSVSSFSSLSTETAASVRETTAAVNQLGQTATQAALTAETVVGIASSANAASRDGLQAADVSTAEMMRLAEEVKALSARIEALNDRMRDIFAIASVVNYIGDRFKSLADSAVVELGRIPANKGIPLALRFIVAEMRRQSGDAKNAATQVKALLADVHRAMVHAMSTAENGVRRAEEGARIAGATGESIRRLVGALEDSSQAARDIAVVAQQQDHGIDQVLKAMNEIFRATEETVVSTKDVADQARALDELARRLGQTVRR